METTLAPRKGLSGNALKYFAAALMVLDHVHQMFGAAGAPLWLTWLGRLVAPIFIFMCAEGFAHTHKRGRYMLRLLLGHVLMQLANTALSLLLPMEDVALMNDIFATLFMCAFYMWLYDMLCTGLRQKRAGKVALAVGLALLGCAATLPVMLALTTVEGPAVQALAFLMLLVPSALFVEGGFLFVLLGLLFYIFRRHRVVQLSILVGLGGVLLAATLLQHYSPFSGSFQWMMLFAAAPLALYNGARGKGGKFSKWFFYIFYPAHIYALYTLAWLALR